MKVQAISPEEPGPSQVIDEYWLFAERKSGTYPASTANCGKWLIFIRRSEIDAWWTKIRAATEQGRFGNSAKVSTLKSKPNVSDPNEHVICVYIYDWIDEKDVRRVRRALGELGVDWEIKYKTDQDTNAGLYAANGNSRISKYSEASATRNELTELWGIGLGTSGHLEAIGIKTCHDLLVVGTPVIVEMLRDRKCYVRPATVDGWKHHAKSYSTSRPVLFGDPLLLHGPFIVLDLEYEPGKLIWLVGVCVQGSGGREYFALWADTAAQEKRNLMRLAEIIAASPLLPVVTWNGKGADLPELRKAATRLKLGQALDVVESRHLDLYRHAIKALRLPIPLLALSEVARYFALPKASCISDGLEALSLYQEYRRSRDKENRVAFKKDLIEYNRDDLDALGGVVERIAVLQRENVSDNGIVAAP